MSPSSGMRVLHHVEVAVLEDVERRERVGEEHHRRAGGRAGPCPSKASRIAVTSRGGVDIPGSHPDAAGGRPAEPVVGWPAHGSTDDLERLLDAVRRGESRRRAGRGPARGGPAGRARARGSGGPEPVARVDHHRAAAVRLSRGRLRARARGRTTSCGSRTRSWLARDDPARDARRRGAGGPPAGRAARRRPPRAGPRRDRPPGRAARRGGAGDRGRRRRHGRRARGRGGPRHGRGDGRGARSALRRRRGRPAPPARAARGAPARPASSSSRPAWRARCPAWWAGWSPCPSSPCPRASATALSLRRAGARCWR